MSIVFPLPPRRRRASSQPIQHAQAALTHSQIRSPGGAARAFDALWQGLVAAEPERLA